MNTDQAFRTATLGTFVSIKGSLSLKKMGNAVHFNQYAFPCQVAKTELVTSGKGPNVFQLLCANLNGVFRSSLGLSVYKYLKVQVE